MTAAEIVIPWRPGCPHRTVALNHVLDLYHRDGFTPVVAEASGDGPWCKALAVTPAVEASSADVIVMADADVYCGGLKEAVGVVTDGGAPWSIPHRLVCRLTPTTTAQVLAGAVAFDNIGPSDCDEPPYRGFAGGGCVVLPRSTYLDVPLDPRFENWGGEDESWARALSTLTGDPWRGTSPLFHLWHPPQPRMNRRHGSHQSEALTFRYRMAKGRPDRMRRIIDEVTACPHSSSSSSRAPSAKS